MTDTIKNDKHTKTADVMESAPVVVATPEQAIKEDVEKPLPVRMTSRPAVFLGVALVVMILVGVGLGVGLSQTNKNDDSRSGGSSNTAAVLIDDSCILDADCAIKDVGSCCGYHPQCVNVDFTPDPSQACPAGQVGDCGYAEIIKCVCNSGTCVGVPPADKQEEESSSTTTTPATPDNPLPVDDHNEPGETVEPYVVDYTCTLDDMCQVKDVGNCCGMYPKCVNANFQPDPSRACAPGVAAGVCGFPEIEYCKCGDDGLCYGYQGDHPVSPP